jgi:inosine/xanthosine triphosphate pyrophosphatase family protein
MLMATRNQMKYLLFQPLFEEAGFGTFTLAAAGLHYVGGLETGVTPLENALIKARYFHSPEYPWVFGDDAGLAIDALNGEPGVETRRWGGQFNEDVDDQTWLDYLMKRLQGVPFERRTASIFAAWALLAPDGVAHYREVRFPFTIASEPFRPILPGSPLTAVRIGNAETLEERRAEIRAEWHHWGVLPELVKRFG